MRLKGKRVFITAAGAGIGRASAEACIREGAEVVACEHRQIAATRNTGARAADGGLLIFVDAAKELPATLILRPFNFDTLATHVYTYASLEQLDEAAPAALLIIIVGLAPVIILSGNLRAARPGGA